MGKCDLVHHIREHFNRLLKQQPLTVKNSRCEFIHEFRESGKIVQKIIYLLHFYEFSHKPFEFAN